MKKNNKLNKFLTTIPKRWADFIKSAPMEFNQGYLDKVGFTREEFLELSGSTKLFDDVFFNNDPADLIYWWCYGEISYPCKGWELNGNEMYLYDRMPDIFTTKEFINLRKAFLPISSQDKMLGGILFKEYKIETVNDQADLARLCGRCYQKTIIKPVLK